MIDRAEKAIERSGDWLSGAEKILFRQEENTHSKKSI
jgi:hypothetical protein